MLDDTNPSTEHTDKVDRRRIEAISKRWIGVHIFPHQVRKTVYPVTVGKIGGDAGKRERHHGRRLGIIV
jgi:hypothetical protein